MEIEKNNYPEYIESVFEFTIPLGQNPERLDVFLANSIKNASRNKVQRAISNGNVIVNNKLGKGSKKVQPNDHIVCTILKLPPLELIPEDIPLAIIYEDDFLLVVNKPYGMVTHPGFGNRYGTLVNALLYHMGMRESITIESDDEDEDNIYNDEKVFNQSDIRPGIVHRLDKDTSGLLVILKNSSDHAKLAEQFANRTIERFYNTLVWGDVKDDKGRITSNIGRSSKDRKLFAVVERGGKLSITDYWVLKRFGFMTLLKIKLGTGRTHQIRVHLSHNNHPVVGDISYGGDTIVYGGNIPFKKKIASKILTIATRQMLHARTLGFSHPETNERLRFTSELPDDFTEVLSILEEIESI